MNTTPPPSDQPGPGAPWQGSGWYGPQGGQPGWQAGPGQPPYAGGPQPRRASGTESFFESIRRWGIVRTEERWIGGVCGGVARRWNLDVALVRGALAASLLLFGAGLLAYGAAWLLLPEERDGRIHLQELFRGNFDIAVVGGFVVAVSGMSWDGPWAWWTPWGGAVNGLFWAVLVTAVVVLVVSAAKNDRNRAPRVPYPGPSAAAYAAAPGASAPSEHSTGADGATDPSSAGYSSSASVPGAGPSSGAGASYTSSTSSTSTSAYDAGAASGAGDVPPTSHDHGAWYSGSPQGQPTGGWTAPVATAPAAPTKPVVKGAGAITVAVVVGLSAIVAASLLALDRAGRFDGPVLLTSLGVLVGLAGLAIMIAGIRGRSSGALGGLAVLAILAAGPAAVWNTVDLDVRNAHGMVVGDQSFTPSTATAAERGFAMGAGSWQLDLTEVPLPTSGDAVTVPVTFGAGELDVTMPSGVAWVADVTLNAGEVTVTSGADSHNSSGVSTEVRRFESDAAQNGATAVLHLTIRGGVGEIRINEE